MTKLTMIGPVSLLAATFLARDWIAISAQSAKGSLPSTPQYLLTVGNLGIPGFRSLWKSVRYYYQTKINASSIFTHSAICLAGMLFTMTMVVIWDVWIHVSSSAVPEQSAMTTSGLHDFSRAFAPPENSTTAPWRLQQGLQTFLGINPQSAVTQIDDTTTIIPADLPANLAVVGLTLGMQLDCDFINLDCTFNQTQSTFDCSSVQPGAEGNLTAANVTLYTGANATNFKLIAAMALPAVFNESTIVVATQVFQCSGALQNVTYSNVNNELNIVSSNAIDYQSLTSLWNLNEFAGKQELLEGVLSSVGTSVIYTQGDDVSTTPSLFADGLSRLFMSFLAGETVPSQSLMVIITSEMWSNGRNRLRQIKLFLGSPLRRLYSFQQL
jgi:hypothetical protein